jgi:hypothetical protein
LKIPWQAALAMVFCSGAGFLLLSVTGLRRRIIEAIPHELKIATTCGIGLFIAFIGLQKGGIIAAHPATLVTAGRLGSPSALLVLGGIVLAAALHARKVKGAIILSVIALTIAGAFVPAPDGSAMLTRLPDKAHRRTRLARSDFLRARFQISRRAPGQTLPLILAFLFVDLFDNMGTLIGVCQRLGLLDAQGRLPGIGRALTADAGAAMVGACLGTSTVTSYIESAAGAEPVDALGSPRWWFQRASRVAGAASAHSDHPAASDRAGACAGRCFHDAKRRRTRSARFRQGAALRAADAGHAAHLQHQRRMAIGFVVYAAFMMAAAVLAKSRRPPGRSPHSFLAHLIFVEFADFLLAAL